MVKLENSEIIEEVFYNNGDLKIYFKVTPPDLHDGTYRISKELYDRLINSESPDVFFKNKIEQHLLISIETIKSD